MPVSTAGCCVHIAAMRLVCMFSQKPLSMLLPDKDSQHQDGTEAELCLRHLREARGWTWWSVVSGYQGMLVLECADREGPGKLVMVQQVKVAEQAAKNTHKILKINASA